MDIEYILKREMLRRGYSPKTIKSYLFCINKFFSKNSKEPSKVSKTEVREYLNNLSEKGVAGNTINVHLNALKFFFEEVLHKRIRLNIKYSKVPIRLPVVLTKEEVKALFGKIKNEKHKLMIELLYSAGLRVSELLNLKVADLELSRDYGWVRAGKGNKDRLFILSNILKSKISGLIVKEKLSKDDFLFKSNRKSKYSTSSPRSIIRKAVKNAGIYKKVGCHTLRHSFATHLIENGYSVTEVQTLLGHKSPETTMIYVHMANPKLLNIKSPLDSL